MFSVRGVAGLTIVLVMCSLFGLFLRASPDSDSVKYSEGRDQARRALAKHDFANAERAWEQAWVAAANLTGAHRAILLLERHGQEAHVGNSEAAEKLLFAAEAELSPWPSSSPELKEATLTLFHIYESASKRDKVDYYRAKLAQFKDSD